MTFMKKKLGPVYLSFLLLLCLIFVLGILFGSFFDLQISSAIASDTSLLAKLAESFGEFLGFGMGCCGMAMITRKMLTKESRLWQKILGVFLAVLVIAILTYFGIDDFSGVAGYSWKISRPISIIGCLIINTSMYLISFFLVDETLSDKELITNGLIIVITEIIALILVNFVFKGLVYRARYRAMAWDNSFYGWKALGFDYYTPWWNFSFWKKPEWFLSLKSTDPSLQSDIIKSWPSGHTASAAMVLVLPFFTSKMKRRNEKNDLIAFWFGFFYTLLIAYARIRKGAHFLSDVSWGGIFTVLTLILVASIAYRIAGKDHAETIAASVD